jgi:hypothetical protein
MVATIDAGIAAPMTVLSGNWTGCAVWVDLDLNDQFDDGENLFHSYVGGDPGYMYTFDLVVPTTTPSGNYRMRVVAPWGSDGFDPVSKNGYGPCGTYQYGNFDDFTLAVMNTIGVAEGPVGTPLVVSPNPTNGMLRVLTNSKVARIGIHGVDARVLFTMIPPVGVAETVLDLSEMKAGPYYLHYEDAQGVRKARFIKM